MRSITVAADDMGMTPGITDGILRCIDHGHVGSVSVLANGWDFARAARELRARPWVQVGVHVNLVEGVPISPPDSIPLLIGADGRFSASFASLWLRGVIGGPRRRRALAAQVEREARAQIERVRAALREDRPLHLDSHRHMHMVPFVFEVFLRLALEHRLRSLRLVREPAFIHAGPGALRAYLGAGIVKHVVLNALARRCLPQLQARGLAHCDYLIGVLFTGRMTAAVARDALAAIGRRAGPAATVEVLFHPGRATEHERQHWSRDPALAAYYCSPERDSEAEQIARLRPLVGFAPAPSA
jgi:predicted glycoside hydrolase/deacetylase ChbG (UPF0249 family)